METLANELKKKMESSSTGESLREVQDQLVKDLIQRREEILEERLEQLGLEMYLKEEEGRRFKRFMRVIEGDKETIYFNDGSINGLRIITFVNSSNTSILNEKYCSTVTITHY